MTQSRSPHDRSGGRSLAPWLALAACLVVASMVVVWLMSGRDAQSTEPTAATSAAPSSSTAASSSASSSASATAVEAPVSGALTVEALLTPADVAAVGLTVDTPAAIDAPAFPVLCAAADWGSGWSAPVQGVGQEYPAQGVAVTEYATGYAAGAAASAALGRLVQDASSCPDLVTGGSVESAGPSTADGDESAVFLVVDGGRDGVVAMTWSVVVRSGDTLLLVTYTTQQQIGTGSGPVDGGDDSGGDSAGARSTAEALARAAVDRFTALT